MAFPPIAGRLLLFCGRTNRRRALRYDAFISYAHGADGPLAAALRAALHRFAKPWHQRRAVNCFLDDSNLALAHSLPQTLTESLDASGHMLLLASPEAASSQWVRAETAYWLENKDPKTLLIVVTGGAIRWDEKAGDFDWTQTTALPRDVAGAFAQEPLYLELTWARHAEEFTPRDPRFLDAVARIAAVLRGVSLDELAGEEVRQFRKTRRIATAAILSVFLLGAAAAAGAIVAFQRSVDARRNLESALRATDTIVAEVAAGMKNLQGIDAKRIRKILDRAAAVVDQLDADASNVRVQELRASLLLEFADVYWRVGDGREALKRAVAARATLERLAGAASGDRRWLRLMMRCHRLIGDQQRETRNIAAATASYRRGLVLSRSHRLAGQPDSRIALERSRIHTGIGITHILGSRLRLAEASFVRALAAATPGAKAAAGDIDWQTHLAQTHDLIGVVYLLRLKPQLAIKSYRTALGLAEKMLTAEPRNVKLLTKVVQSLYRIGVAYRYANKLDAAQKSHERALERTEALIASNPDTVAYQSRKAAILDAMGDVASDRKEWSRAGELYARAAALRADLASKSPDNNRWRNGLAYSQRNLGDARLGNGDWRAARDRYAESLRIITEVIKRDTRNNGFLQNLAYAHRGMGRALLLGKDRSAALEHLKRAAALFARLNKAVPDNAIWARDWRQTLKEIEELERS